MAGLESGTLWSIILAGGEGMRLRPLVERIHADGRPKQFAVLVGSKSLLRHTLDRSARLVPPERTVVVTTRSHESFFAGELWGEVPPRVLVQPSDRGTAAGVLLPAHRIARIDPDAYAIVLPSDHYVGDDAVFMTHVERLAAAAYRHPMRILLAGARPDGPDTGYGWIQPGVALEKAPVGGLNRIDRFLEKPTEDDARVCMARGGLWNTFVMAARVRTDRTPEDLLDLCLAVERDHGRVRTVPGGPRTLDIDLLDFEGVTRATARLTLPHPRLASRRFVLAPLAELDARFRAVLDALRDPHAVRLYSAPR